MPEDKRRDAATAATGAGLLAGGGVVRHAGISRAVPSGKFPVVHPAALVRRGAKGRRLYALGTAMGVAGLPALAVGSSRLVSGDVDKRAPDERGFWREGLGGTVEALGGRAETLREPVPGKVRAQQLGIGAAAGGLGSLAARAALGRKGDLLKPALTPVGGGLAAAASVPASSKIIERKNPGYVVTPYGVRRAKKAPAKPSSKASTDRGLPRSFRHDIGKAESYLGARTGYGTQRAAVTAAGHPPVIGPITAALAAGKYAPPGQERKAALRQYGMGSVAPVGIGVAGAYAGAKAAAGSKKAEARAEQLLDATNGLENKARGLVGMKAKARKPWAAPAAGSLRASRALSPLTRSPARAAGAAAGFLGAKAAGGLTLGQGAITLNQRDQKQYNARRGISKGLLESGQTKREKRELAGKKRASAALSATGGVAGLTSLGLLMARKKSAATTAGIIGSGFGGTNALLMTPIQRKEAQALAPVKKGAGVPIIKREPLELKNDRKTNDDLVRRYGDRGPLPKGLDRDTKMKAYEARYVKHGGHKANKYAQRAEVGEGVKNIGLGVATAGGAAYLAAKTKLGNKLAGKAPKARRVADNVAIGGGVAGGAGEIYSGYAHQRQSSYSNTPGGVAGSALRRMRSYTPAED